MPQVRHTGVQIGSGHTSQCPTHRVVSESNDNPTILGGNMHKPDTVDGVRAQFTVYDLYVDIHRHQGVSEDHFIDEVANLPARLRHDPMVGWESKWRDEPYRTYKDLNTAVCYLAAHIEQEFEALREAKNVRVLHAK